MCLGNHDYGKKSVDGSYSDNFKHQINYSYISKKWVLPKDIILLKEYDNTIIEFFVIDTNFFVMDQETIDKQLDIMKKY